jgi:quercetin dioxygenase-like cupin family protein
MNANVKAKIIGPKQGDTVLVAGDLYTYLARSEDTGGTYAAFDVRVSPGGGPPPHLHRRENEAFFILEGELTFLMDGRQIRAAEGMFLHAPIGVPHTF